MIMWFRNLPSTDIDFSKWEPFIKNPWYRKHYMKFVYLLMISILLAPNLLGTNILYDLLESTKIQMSKVVGYMLLILVIPIIFIIHELLHLIVIYNNGNISITFSGIFWINTDATLSKARFWLFMSLLIIILSIVPSITSLFLTGLMKTIMLYISWINLIISSSDIFNTILILMKPNNSVFCRGYYRNN